MIAQRINPEFAAAESLYEFREATEEDIPAIRELLFDWYGPSYPYPVSALDSQGYYPAAIDRSTGRLVGFAKAVPYKGFPSVYEFGGLIVAKSHREKKIAKHLTRMRVDWVLSLGGAAVVSEPVCYLSGCPSQENLIKAGFHLVALQVGKYPDIMHDTLGLQPESVLMAVRWLRGNSRLGHRKVFLPRYYRGVLHSFLPRYLYQRPWDETFEDVPMPPAVLHKGFTTAGGTGAEFADVPVNWPEAEGIIHNLRLQGFRMCGILPGFGRLSDDRPYDYLRMYRLPASFIIGSESFDFDKVNVVPQLAALKHFASMELHGDIPIE